MRQTISLVMALAFQFIKGPSLLQGNFTAVFSTVLFHSVITCREEIHKIFCR